MNLKVKQMHLSLISMFKSIIQQFNNSTIQQFNNSTIQQFNKSTIQQINNLIQ
jgi:hypothetical protein